MISRNVILGALILSATSVAVHAEDCHQYPKGKFRWFCKVRNHPGLEAKCKQEGMKIGLNAGADGSNWVGAYSAHKAGGLEGFVKSCMKRKLKERAA